MIPVVTALATVTCSYPAGSSKDTGSTFSDGATPSAGVNVNECDNGTPSMENGDWHAQYQYWVYVGNSNGGYSENDVSIAGRAWACGTLVYSQSYDWSQGGSFTSGWYDYGNGNSTGSHCNQQYDLNVKVTAWSGQQWADYQTEKDGGCTGDGSIACEGGT
jgi:hypothetical protein